VALLLSDSVLSSAVLHRTLSLSATSCSKLNIRAGEQYWKTVDAGTALPKRCRPSHTEKHSGLTEWVREGGSNAQLRMADKLMTMIDDMQFRKDSIWGTCARYFLLIDLSWFPQLCFSAQINSEKLRAYLWLCERGEIEHIFDDAETVVPFLRKRDSQQALNTPQIVKPFAPVAATKKANA
jgi:hypothetical protein